MTWRPYSARHDPSKAALYDALHPGVPPWAVRSIQAWVASAISILGGDRPKVLEMLLRDMEVATHLAIDDVPFVLRSLGDEQFTFDVLDYLLTCVTPRMAQNLERTLCQAGMAVRVASNGGSLERRVPDALVAQIDLITSSSGRAAQHAALAWRSVYGRAPNPSHGFREAVRAVEAAAAPVIEPKNAKATLGTMIRVMENSPGRWGVTLELEPVRSSELLLSMMRGLWKAQFDRHGTADPDVPVACTLPEAETALHLALTLVQWFASGRISRS